MTRHNSCLSPLKEICISIIYLPQSLSAILKFPSSSLKNLGFSLDCHLTMNAHVSNIARTCYLELRSLESISRFLTSTANATLVFAFVLSRIDYSNNNNNGYFYVLFLRRAHSHFILKNNNGVNIELGKTNRLKALRMMQINI